MPVHYYMTTVLDEEYNVVQAPRKVSIKTFRELLAKGLPPGQRRKAWDFGDKKSEAVYKELGWL